MEYACPGTNLSRTLTCNVSNGTHTEWKVTDRENTVNTFQFVTVYSAGKTLTDGVRLVATLISVSSNSLLSKLVTSGRSNLLPITVQCSVGSVVSEYILTFKGKKEKEKIKHVIRAE